MAIRWGLAAGDGVENNAAHIAADYTSEILVSALMGSIG